MISQMLSYINKIIEDLLVFLSIRKSSLACFQHIPEDTSEDTSEEFCIKV